MHWPSHKLYFNMSFQIIIENFSCLYQRGEKKDIADINIIKSMQTNCIYEKKYLKGKHKRYIIYTLKEIKRKVKNLIIRCIGMVVK